MEKKFKNTEKCDILKLCHKIGFEEYFGNDKEDNRFTWQIFFFIIKVTGGRPV